MASTWEKIPQTHRAILFEEFTSPADNSAKNLYDILAFYNDSSASDVEMYKDIEDNLEVRSFNEFLEKFQPKVFEYVTGTADGIPVFQYTTDPMEAAKNNGQPINITSHTYYEMLVNMYNQKGDSGLADIEFNDSKLREILTPKREIEALYDTRRQIPLLMEKYNEAKARNENAAPFANRLNKFRQEAFAQLKHPVSLMAIRLDDINRQITAINKEIKQLNSASKGGSEAPKLLSGRGGFDDKGRWILIPAKATTPDSNEATDSPSDPNGDSSKQFGQIIENYLNKHAANENNFTKALIVSAYTGTELSNPLEGKDSAALIEAREQLVDYKKIIEGSFKQAKEAFIKVLSESVQKLLCVKIFFDHATVKGGNDAKLPTVGLIVANCKASKLIDDKVKGKFEATMRHLGTGVSDKNKLWFAILPHVLEGEYSDGAGSNGSIDDDIFGTLNQHDDDLDSDSANKSSAMGTDFSAAKSLIKILDESKILTVFNFAPKPKTTFSALNADTVNELQEKLTPLNCEHAVYALPNFTIMREGTVPLSDEADTLTISVPAMYIDASYVAAGLLVAAQQKEFWLSRGFREKESFNSENACVRIDFESNKVVPKLLTKFNRERSIAWSAEVVNALSQKRFGFAFDGDPRYDEQIGGFLARTYILNARTLKQKDGEYQPIFRTLMKDFVQAYLKTYGARGMKLSKSQMNDFLNNVVRDWAMQCKKFKTDIVNFLLRDGENILQVDKKLKVELSGGEELLDVEIVD